MYRGFNFQLGDGHFGAWYDSGILQHRRDKFNVEVALNQCFDDDGVISAAKVTESWFPSIDAEVFISHSHADSREAIGLAGWLNEKFGLKAFVDSTVWGYAAKLQKKFDKEYCYNEESGTYDYDKRNRTTSYVNIMLSSALHNMIDEAECVIFLNSPNSSSCKGYVTEEATHSPWIFSEISMTRLIKPKLRRDRALLRKVQASTEALDESMNVKFDLSLNHFATIGGDDLKSWEESVPYPKSRGAEALDYLYSLHPLR